MNFCSEKLLKLLSIKALFYARILFFWLMSIRKTWKNLQNAGIHEELSLREEKTVRLVNILMLIFILITASAIPTVFFSGNWFSLFLSLIGVTIYSTVIFFNYSRKYSIANHVFVIYTSSAAISSNFLFGEAVGFSYAFVAMPILPIVVFKRSSTIYSYLVVFILIFYVADYYQTHFPPLIEREAQAMRIQYFFNVTAILVCTFLMAFFFRRINDTYESILVKKNEVIAQKNKDITDSITYAQRIQEAILPTKQEIQAIFSQNFVFYQPRDIVSGDFYWITQTEVQPIYEEEFSSKGITTVLKKVENEKKIIAAIDCTGHGVPGAFMSMIGESLLNQIVIENKIVEPHLILEELHKKVKSTLRQNQDGMDMALVVIDEQEKTLKFAGAKNPLVYVLDGKLETIKGSRFSIGGNNLSQKVTFDCHEIPLEKPLTFYLFSDGLQDQFGGKNGKKFMRKRLHQLLQEVQQYPIQDQKTRIEKAWKNWKQHEEQIDDVLLIGVHLNLNT